MPKNFTGRKVARVVGMILDLQDLIDAAAALLDPPGLSAG